MAVTYRSQDKYAFLFTGPTLDRFVKDLENVFQVLVEYYNYPPANIMVVLGSTPAVMPSFLGASVTNITTVVDLENALTNFAGMASGPAPPLPGMVGIPWTTALLYFTGGGISEASVSKLVIDGGLAGTNNVDPAWLTTRLNAISDCHVNVVMQQPYSGGFVSALTGSTLTQWSFTYACSDAQDSYGNNILGSFFTHGWVKGLKLETLPAGTLNPGMHADKLGTAGESTNRLVSLEEAKEFGKQIHDSMGYGSFATPGYSGAGGSQYLGLPAFLIRDGSTYWWESPDIYLTYPNHSYLPPGDLYIPDPLAAISPFNNTINIDVRNKGTHPVRKYSLGIELFKSGASVTNEQNTACDIIPSAVILLPIDIADIGTPDDKKDTYQWNTPFYIGTTHECVKAEAKLLCSDVDFVWSIKANQYEGQRNTDEMTIVPPPPAPPPLPSPFSNLRGFKEHLYGIQNHFDGPRRFIVVFPEEYTEYQDLIELMWFDVSKGPQSERVPLDVVDEPVLHIPFMLKAGEKTDILLHAEMKPNFDLEDGIELPFEILVEGEWSDEARATTHAIHLPNYAAIAGFTLIVKNGSATLKGTVVDTENKPVPEATVFLRTVNDLQGAVIATDKEGRYTFTDINPDIYRIWAGTQSWHTKEQTVVLLSGKEEEVELHLTEEGPVTGKRVRVILDKIRIMSDKDPCIKGKGEITFTSIVTPDCDTSRKRVTRLPTEGVFHVGDEPGRNEIRLEAVIFDGIIQNRSLSISVIGREIDLFDPDDEFNRYHRVFSGNPEEWLGEYHPYDEYLDQEHLGDWAIWYRIVRG